MGAIRRPLFVLLPPGRAAAVALMALPFAAWLLYLFCSRARKTANVHLAANLGFPRPHGKAPARGRARKENPARRRPDGAKGERKLLGVGTAS